MLAAVTCICLLGCSHQVTPAMPAAPISAESLPDLSERNQQVLAQAYFRLGVSVSARLILEHAARGEQIPPPNEFLKECIQFDIAASNGKTLLKVP